MKLSLLPQDKIGFTDASVFAIMNWRLLVVACIGLLTLAYLSWNGIPRLEDPKVDAEVIQVSAAYPGASPEDVEAQVITLLEQEFFSLDGIKDIDSTATPGLATLTLTFEEGSDVDSMVEKVRGKVQQRKKDLPDVLTEPTVLRVSTALFPQMVVAVAGGRSEDVLTQVAKDVRRRLITVPGVSAVILRGHRMQGVRIQLDPVRLQQHGMTPEVVVAQLQRSNVRLPSGRLEVGAMNALLQVNQEFKDAASIMRMPVGTASDAKGGHYVLSLGEVADVKEEGLTPSERFMSNGLPAVGLEIRFRTSENAVDIGARVRKVLDELKASAPEGTTIETCYEQPEWIDKSINNLLRSLFEAIVLVLLVITLGMGWRAAVVIAGVLPLAMAGTIFGLNSFGFSLDIMTIAGVVIALGLLVDDAVVVTESIQIMRDKGISPIRAAVFGTSRVFWANNGTTCVACAAFLPLLFTPGATGRYLRGMPASVILALITSLVVAQFFTPWASLFFLKTPKGIPLVRDDEPFARTEDSSDEHAEHNRFLRYLQGLYARHIGWVVGNPLKVIIAATGMLVGAMVLLPTVGVQYFPKIDKPVLFVTVELAPGTKDEIVASKLSEVVAILHDQPEVKATSATMGSPYPTVIGSRAGKSSSNSMADIFVRLNDGLTSDDVAPRLRGLLAAVSGARVSVQEVYYDASSSESPISVRVVGDDIAKLRAYAKDIKAKIREVPGTVNVDDSLSAVVPVAQISLDADKAQRVGLTPGQVGDTLRLLYGEDSITDFRNGEDEFTVVIEAKSTPETPFAVVEQVPVRSATGTLVPLRQAGEMKMLMSSGELRRHNARRIVDITAGVEAGTLPSDVIDKLDAWLPTVRWEPGYSFRYTGVQEESNKSFTNLAVSALSALLVIFLLLVLMFKSIGLALVVILAVPYAMIGTVAGLWLTRTPFGFMSFLGIIALIGVYVNHKIYFVDRLLELMRRGSDFPNAVLRAGQDRLRPVLLTALTAILGLLPLALGAGPLWIGYGWVNIFGLLASIPLSLVLLPAMICVVLRVRARLVSLLPRSDAQWAAPVGIEPRDQLSPPGSSQAA